MHAFKTLFVLALAIACIFADDKVDTKGKIKKDVFGYTGYPYAYSGYTGGLVPSVSAGVVPSISAYSGHAVAYQHPAGVIASPYSAGLYKPYYY